MRLPRTSPRYRLSPWSTPALVVIAVAITFLVTSGPILLAGANPIAAYAEFVVIPLTSRFTLLEVLVSATPILFTGAAVAIAFRAGYWNIGAEGQLLLGALPAAGVGAAVGDLPAIVALPAMLATGALAGASWALLPALLRVRFGIDEVVTTLLLNPVALLLVTGLLHGPWRDPVTGFPESPRLAGLAGVSEVAGIQHRLTGGLSPGYGYTGIVVATLGTLAMPGVILAALFLGDLAVGASTAPRSQIGRA